MIVRNAGFYKIGIVVENLDTAVRELSELYDHEWLEVPSAPHPFLVGDEVMELTQRAVISRQKPRLHLLQVIPGTPWVPAPRNAVHHLAFWVDDFAAATAEMKRAGYTVECGDVTEDGIPVLWSYFNNDAGMRVELLHRPSFPGEEEMIEKLPAYRPS